MMKKWKNLSARGFALFLALIMCLSSMQLTAFAEDAEDAEPAEPPVGDVIPGNDDGADTPDDDAGNDDVDQTRTEVEAIYDADGNLIGTRTTVYAEDGSVISSYEETHTTTVDGNTVTNTDNTSSFESTENGGVTGSSNQTESTEYDELGRPVHVSGEASGETITTENGSAEQERDESETVESVGSGSASSSTEGEFEETEDSAGGELEEPTTGTRNPDCSGNVSVDLNPGDSNKPGVGASLTDEEYKVLIDSLKPDNNTPNETIAGTGVIEDESEELLDDNGNKIGDKTVTDNGGTKTTTVEEKYDDSGKQVGWTTTVVEETSKTTVTTVASTEVRVSVTDTKGRPIPEEGDLLDDDGNVIGEVEYERDEDGNVTNYIVTTPILGEDGTEIGSSSETYEVITYSPDYTGVITTAPEATEEPIVTVDEETGTVTTYEVEYELDEDGNLVCYVVTTTVVSTGEDGRVNTDVTVETYKVDSVSQTDSTTTTDTVSKTTTTTVTVTTRKTHVTEIVVTDVTDRTITGSMGAESNKTQMGAAGSGNGETLDNIGPGSGTLTLAEASQNHLKTGSDYNREYDSSNRKMHLRHYITANGITINGREPTLYKLEDVGDNGAYVYCIQHGLDFAQRYEWGLEDFNSYVGKHTSTDSGMIMGSASTATWEISGRDAAHIQYIIQNAWWGADSGVGSLDYVKTLSGVTNPVLDEGVALAVTQAALWHFSAANGTSIDFSDIAGIPANQQATAQALYNALIKGDATLQKLDEENVGEKDSAWTTYLNSNPTGTDYIQSDEQVFTNSSVTVMDQVDSSNITEVLKEINRDSTVKNQSYASGNDLTSLGKDLYKTDLSVTIAVVPSRLNSDDMMLYVYVDGIDQPVAVQRLVDGNPADTTSTTVTFEGIVLPSGVNLTLRLNGTQTLAGSAYVFNCKGNSTTGNGTHNKSQTMGGYIATAGTNSQKNNVNVSTTMSFNVTEPTATVTTSQSDTTEQKTDTQMTADSTISTEEVIHSNVTTVLEITIVENDSWENSWEYNYVYNDERPGDDDDDDDDFYYPGDDDDDDVYIPGDDDDDDVTVPDAPTPLSDTPVEIPDAPAPLTEAPVENAEQPEEDLELPETPIPLADMPAEEEPAEEEELELPDGDIPLVDVPATGDGSAIWYAMAGLAVLGLTILTVLGRKREEERR